MTSTMNSNPIENIIGDDATVVIDTALSAREIWWDALDAYVAMGILTNRRAVVIETAEQATWRDWFNKVC